MVRKPKSLGVASKQPQRVMLKLLQRWLFRSRWFQSFFETRQNSHRVWRNMQFRAAYFAVERGHPKPKIVFTCNRQEIKKIIILRETTEILKILKFSILFVGFQRKTQNSWRLGLRNSIKLIGDPLKLQFCAPNTSRSHASDYPKGNICNWKHIAFPQYLTPRIWAEMDFRMKVSPQFDHNIDNIVKIFLMSELFQ